MRNVAFILITLFFLFCNNEKDSFLIDAVYFPKGGENLIIGGIYDLKWQLSNSEFVDIYLVDDNDNNWLIKKELNNNGKYVWQLDDDIPVGNNYSIIIANSNDSSRTIHSNSTISVLRKVEKSIYTDIRDNQDYRIVKIGNQWWFAENLKYKCNTGAYYYSDDSSYYNKYGLLYDHATAIEICPTGWHLPSDDEWKELELYLGMAESQLENWGERGFFAGELLKEDKGSGFDVVFSGYRNSCFGKYGHHLYEAHFWTSSLTREDDIIIRVIEDENGAIVRLKSLCHGGCSVRYIKDMEE